MTRFIQLIPFSILFCFAANAEKNINGNIMVNDVQREYIIHLPSGYTTVKKLPLVLIFHGGGGNDKQIQSYMGMDPIADRENFICVYPRGINKQWNDGRDFKRSISDNDDVKFISNLLDTLIRNYSIDSR